MYVAIINVPGYLSEQDELPEFERISEAWEYLIDQRQVDLGDPINDEDEDDDQALAEMEGMLDDLQLGTVYGFTPGYDGDHDLGLAYSVVRQDLINRC